MKIITDSETAQFALDGDVVWTWDPKKRVWVDELVDVRLTPEEFRIDTFRCELNDGGGSCVGCGRALPGNHQLLTEPNSPIMFDTCGRTECNTAIAANSIHRG